MVLAGVVEARESDPLIQDLGRQWEATEKMCRVSGTEKNNGIRLAFLNTEIAV